MKNFISIIIVLISCIVCSAQQETLDYASYTPPAGWKKDDSHPNSNIIYSSINNKKRTWCQIAIYKATASKGNIDTDFNSEWEQLVKPLGVMDAPLIADTLESDGWKIKNGTGNFSFNGSNASTSLTTISGYNVCFSVVVNTNSDEFAQSIQDFLNSVQLNKPENTQTGNPDVLTDLNQNNTTNTTTALKDKYAFNSTNWDDGWVSTVQQDWVEVKKGTVRVLLHYAKEGTIFPADPEPLTTAAWNVLVAPRYSNLTNFKTTSVNTYNRPYMGMGYATETSSQQQKFIVLFRQGGGWIEVITPDKNTFVQQFKFDPETIRWDSESEPLNAVNNMAGYNRFAVAESDIDGTGKWNDHFASNTFYTNIYTGNSAGMSTYSSSQWFDFGSGKTYKWQLIAANSYGGRTDVAQAKGEGTFKSLNNWQLYFRSIEGKPKKYDVYFTAIRGGRVLFMNDAEHPGSGIFTGYSKD